MVDHDVFLNFKIILHNAILYYVQNIIEMFKKHNFLNNVKYIKYIFLTFFVNTPSKKFRYLQ